MHLQALLPILASLSQEPVTLLAKNAMVRPGNKAGTNSGSNGEGLHCAVHPLSSIHICNGAHL